MKPHCNVIKDLLPLYAEDMLSCESKTLVSEHLSECADCKRHSEELSRELTPACDNDSASIKKVRSRLRKHRLYTVLIAVLAMLTAVAMILSYVESLLPQIGIPGVKMGLANIAVIFALFRFGWKEAAALSLVRVVLVSLLFGSVGAMLYSLAGAVLSLAVMALLRRIDRFSTVGISVAGGVAHNAGQILMAMLILQTKQLLGYLPVLAVSGIAGGVLTGLAAALLIRRIPE